MLPVDEKVTEFMGKGEAASLRSPVFLMLLIHKNRRRTPGAENGHSHDALVIKI